MSKTVYNVREMVCIVGIDGKNEKIEKENYNRRNKINAK